jgi:hypothetical protein
MTNANFKIGQMVAYSNGSNSTHTGQVVKVKSQSIIVIDSAAGMELWNAGCSIGSEISFNQVKK